MKQHVGGYVGPYVANLTRMKLLASAETVWKFFELTFLEMPLRYSSGANWCFLRRSSFCAWGR